MKRRSEQVFLNTSKTAAGIGFFNSLTLIVIVFLPAFFALNHLSQNTSDLLLRADNLRRSSFETEINDFSEALIPRNFIERALHKMEIDLTLRTHLMAEEGNDPGIYNSDTNSKILSYLAGNFGIKPIFLLSFEYDAKKSYSFYSKDFAARTPLDKKTLEHALIFTTIIEVLKNKFWSNPILKERMNSFEIYGNKLAGHREEYLEALVCNFFSPVAYIVRVSGTCREIFTTSFGSQKLYFYFNATQQGNHTLGGYFTVFASRDISYNAILKEACKGSGDFARRIVRCKLQPKTTLIEEKDGLSLLRRLPEPLQMHLANRSSKISSANLDNCFLRVFSSNSKLNKNLLFYRPAISFAQKALILFLFLAGVYLWIHGLTIAGKLRRKILLISGLIILLPYILIASFAALIIDQTEKIRKIEIQAIAESKMYEATQFVRDLSLKRQLIALTAKKHIADQLMKAREGLFPPTAAQLLLPATSREEISVFLDDGRIKVLSPANSNAKMPMRLVRYSGYRFLDNLGVLQNKSNEIKRELEVANLASGFLSGFRHEYENGKILSYEGCEVKNLIRISPLSRMTYFLLPAAMGSIQQVAGISFILNFDLSKFGGAFDSISQGSNKTFRDNSAFSSANFAIGQRNAERNLEQWWPATLTGIDPEKQLLEYASLKSYSGSEVKQKDNIIRAASWKYSAENPYVFAGIVESSPDLWLIFLLQLLPFACAAFSILSLILLADFLWELFARPVKEFIPALQKISTGEYRTRIIIEKTDELGMLAQSYNSMAQGLQQREKMRRFVPERLIERVANETIQEQGRAENIELSVLSSDIRGFTSLSEKHPPEEIVTLLNDYFSEMETAVKEYGGSVERFIGDAVVAVFYPDTTAENHAKRALNSAFEMRRRLKKLNSVRQKNGQFTVENGIGIVTDQAMAGVTGARSGRQVFMVIGSIIPRANELEALTASLSGEKIAVCEKTAEICSEFSFIQLTQQQKAFTPVGKK
ncbi:MAG: HAMP domain-containing protein [Candidatus Riflebacteria bacterium]|nr:HAMP domain-containing protein [Candidatus Riflebacteria bacterium]